MKFFTTLFFIFLKISLCIGQINTKDSIVNPRTFWNVEDAKNYTFKIKEIRKTNTEITLQVNLSYNINVLVKDIFEDETTVSWKYTNVNIDEIGFLNIPTVLLNNVSVQFVIDSEGRFLRFKDLENTINEIKLSAEQLQNQYLNNQDILNKITELTTLYIIPNNTEKIFEKDIKQFHLFYGHGTFKPQKTEVKLSTYMDNLFNESPTPAQRVIKLNEIAFTGTNYIMSSLEIADKEWLANSWYNYLKNLSLQLNTEEPDPKRLEDEIIYKIETISRIQNNGWLNYSLEVKTVNFQDTNYLQERTIELN